MPAFYAPLDLAKNELRNAVVQNLASAPSSPVKGLLYFDSTGNILYCYNGSGWVAAQGGAGAVPATTVTTQAIGDAPVVGTATTYAREDHKHGEPAFGSSLAETAFGLGRSDGVATSIARADHTHGNPALTSTAASTQAIGDAATVGASAFPARDDHKHAMPGFGSVSNETSFGSATANGSAGTVARSDHAHGNPAHVAGDHSAFPLSTFAAPLASLSLNSQKIVNLLDPTNAQDAASKNYVDNLIAGLAWKDSVRVASAGANVAALSGLIAIDSVTVSAGDRVLLKDQTTANQNGIYVASASAWSRATDADLGTEVQGMAAFVEEGTVNADTAWTCTTNAPITVGTTALAFVQFAGGGSVTAGAGMTQSGNVLNVITGDTSLVVNADELHVNTAVMATVASVNTAVAGVAKKFAGALTGTASPETITHNLNTRDIALTVLNGASPYTAVEVDWDATTVNTAVIRYNPNLGAGYRVVVVG